VQTILLESLVYGIFRFHFCQECGYQSYKVLLILCAILGAYHQKVNKKRKDTEKCMKQLWKVLKGKVRNAYFIV